MGSWVQSLIDVCINVSCTNEVYKHLHHGIQNLFVDKIGKKKKKASIFFHGMA
jgi:hypothetical protein